MKSFIFTCSLFIAPLGGYFAQSSLPLLNDSFTWSCYGDFFYLNVKYRLGGDTIINEKSFKKVMAYTDDSPFSFDVNLAEYKSAIREENGIVSVIEKGFSAENILYNFNKQTGDTILFYRPIGNFSQGVLPHYVIGKIYKTDVVVINGIQRKRWFIHDPYMVNLLPPQALSGLDSQADIWIEGIGSKTGLFSRMPEWGVVGPQPYLLACVESDGTTVYSNNTGYNASPMDPCFIIPPQGAGVGNDSLILLNRYNKLENIEIKLYPNPATNTLNISPINEKSSEVRIIDLLGNEVFKGFHTISNNTLTIDILHLNPGYYVAQVQTKDLAQRFRFYKN